MSANLRNSDAAAQPLPPAFNAARHFLQGNLDAGRGAKALLHHGGQVWTYDAVARSVRRMAGLLRSWGVGSENRVAILLPDVPEQVIAFWGAMWAGAVPVPINTSYSADDIRYILQDSRARVLVTSASGAQRLGRQACSEDCHVVIVDGGSPLLPMLRRLDEEPAAAETHRDEPAFWLYTSGTTGRPKGVIHAHGSMVECAERYARQTIGLTEHDLVYSVARIPFAYGLGNTLYMPMAVGASAVLSDAENAFDVVADVARHRPTVLFAIPATYAAILAIGQLSPLDASSLRLCVSAAEQLPETIWQAWRERHALEICEGIGTTEALHIFISNRPGECRPGTSGRAVTGYDVRVVDSDGRAAGPGEIGDLEVTGDSLMLGYWNRLRETRAALHGTTLRTGDKYVVDADGFFRFMGRSDDLFKVNGLWVSPMEVEDILLGHPAVLACAVVPERVAQRDLPSSLAYVALKDEHRRAAGVEESIRGYAKSRLPHFKAPRAVRVVSSLPRTVTGKIDRKAVRAWAAGDAGAHSGPSLDSGGTP